MKEINNSPRNYRFSARVKKEWLTQLKKISYEENINYAEILEKTLDFYTAQRERKKH
jgi:hypothetical protein